MAARYIVKQIMYAGRLPAVSEKPEISIGATPCIIFEPHSLAVMYHKLDIHGITHSLSML